MSIYQMNNYILFQIKENNFIDKSKPKLNKTWIVHTQTNGNKDTYINTQNLKTQFKSHWQPY